MHPDVGVDARHPAQGVLVDRHERGVLGWAEGELRKAAGDVAQKTIPEARVSVQPIQKSAELFLRHQALLSPRQLGR
jgi:hypothetical protein